MHPRAAEFAERARERHGFDPDVTEFPEGTETAAAAAAAIGCETAQIASSLVFEAGRDVVVVVASGANRVSEARLAAHLGVPESTVGTAAPERIRETVGWSIGGVPPFCHDADLPTLLDPTLETFETVWAAAGTPEAVFPVPPATLRGYAGAELADVVE
jgi:prolyl-tRNA editing enzyme YbaK/EbsC (Cys-tRNA(Pro) deacylase)